MSAHLTGLYLNDNVKDWQSTTVKLLRRLGLEVANDKWRCFTWNPDQIRVLNDLVMYVDAIQLRSIWIGGCRRATGLIPQRLYIDASGARITKREFEILQSLSRPSADIDGTFDLIEKLLEVLPQIGGDIFERRIDLDRCRPDLAQ